MRFNRLLENLLTGLNSEEVSYSNIKLRGEYWIDDSGNVEFADGDIGDKNHSMIILQLVMSHLMGVFNIEFYDEAPSGMNDLQEDDLQKIGEVLKDGGYWTPKEDDEEFGLYSDQYAAFEKYLYDNNPYKSKDQLKDAIQTVMSHSNSFDPRNYGMKWLGYIRVAGNEVQTWYLRPNDLANIESGLYNIMDQDNIDENEDILLNIEVVSTKKYYQDVPLSDIKSGDVVKVALHENIKSEE